ncbi:Telomere_Sde2 domain containing protein [Klebsormidium nitens]|uniref:Telomere_Sde2 domain containing protein n=1 Tax=Klebsormidium nitens TaxID=105231 RepID=A0A1Y1HW20_KLENI|nr:Telomere_Sde2 domain containing protein [Klebsormidium nitens]|eukprot:GAQ82363.1 Telomere_Sde2 domain containing protein [Klebsormidium nitens]
MASFQVFVKNLQGESKCLRVGTPSVTGRELVGLVEDAEGIPSVFTRLVTGTSQLDDDSILSADDRGLFPSCTLLARLLGGKGGFGSLLRGSQSQKKTTNFDACRDMNGRRLRHVNSEKKLVEWQEQAKDREQEKLAAEQVKKDERELKQKVEKDNALAQLREQTEVILDKVEDAVKDAMSSKAAGKRKVEEPESVSVVKRVRMFGILEEEDEEESGDEDEGLDKDATVGPSGVATGDAVGPSHATSEATAEDAAKRDEKTDVISGETEAGSAGDQGNDTNAGADVENAHRPAVASNDGEAKEYGRPLDFSMFESAQEMEALGLERLKEELQDRGLKCGGSLSERAARLFLLKSVPLEKLDKKLFAKAPSSKKGT